MIRTLCTTLFALTCCAVEPAITVSMDAAPANTPGVGLVPGRSGGAWHFDGTGGVEMREALKHEGPFTWALWVKSDPAAADGYHALVAGATGHCYLRLAQKDIVNMNLGGWHTLKTDKTVEAGAWHHVAVSFDGSTLIAYIDGAEVQRADKLEPKPAALVTGASFHIGQRNAEHVEAFRGDLDDLRIWRKALDAADIAALAKTTP